MSNRLDTTELKQIILQVVASIPQGKVASYGQVARLCGYPGYARFVGSVLRQLPQHTTLPWYRVINSQGKIAFPKGSEAYTKQLAMLTKDGVKANDGKVAMRIYGWSA